MLGLLSPDDVTTFRAASDLLFDISCFMDSPETLSFVEKEAEKIVALQEIIDFMDLKLKLKSYSKNVESDKCDVELLDSTQEMKPLSIHDCNPLPMRYLMTCIFEHPTFPPSRTDQSHQHLIAIIVFKEFLSLEYYFP